ncbi:DUF4282 domain-containing protein [Candidatus Woesearchaeota archaeon]|nr:DUF4282 domain-containing protein [Candidatus Woesearchaeota archaeon]
MKSTEWGDFLEFRKMLTPVIIKAIFWLGSIISVIAGIVTLVGGLSGVRGGYYQQGNAGAVVMGFLMIILGPVAIRIWCEIMILFFQMNDTLTDILNNTKPK